MLVLIPTQQTPQASRRVILPSPCVYIASVCAQQELLLCMHVLWWPHSQALEWVIILLSYLIQVILGGQS